MRQVQRLTTERALGLETYLVYYILSSCSKRTFSLPQPMMQVQQKRCPHSVAQLSVLSSRQSVQFLPALNASGIDDMSNAVPRSSSVGVDASASGSVGAMRVDTARSSRKLSRELGVLVLAGSFPFFADGSSAYRCFRVVIKR